MTPKEEPKRAKPGSAESIQRNLSCLQKQGHLLVRLGNELADEKEALASSVLSLMMPAIADSCGSLAFLIPNHRFRDAFVTGRTIYLTILNGCFICSQGNQRAERALRHASQKAYRDLRREFKLNDQTIVLGAMSMPDSDSDPRLSAALREYTGRKGREITQWTPESVADQLGKIDSKYGGKVGAMLALAMMVIYRHASEVAHGTLFGVLWSIGATDKKASSIEEFTENRDRHWSSSLAMLLFSLNVSVWALFKIVAKEFPSRHPLYEESDVLLRELISTLDVERNRPIETAEKKRD